MAWISSLALSSTAAGYAPAGVRTLHSAPACEPAIPAPEADVAAAVLDALAVAIVVVDGTCRMLHANAAARHMLQSTTAFVRSRERLVAARRPVSEELSASVARVARGDVAHSQMDNGLQIATAATIGLDITVLRVAWPGMQSQCATAGTVRHGACAAVLIRQRDCRHPAPTKAFIEQHKITRAEARVLARLMAGDRLQDAAATLELSAATVKTHLQHLFAKTGTKRQAELVLLAMSATAPPAMW